MLTESGEGHGRAKVLCVRSQAMETLLDEALSVYDTTALHDGRVALRKARFGLFDGYLAIDSRSARAAVLTWQGIRGFDSNTPFVLVTSEALPDDVALKAGYDAHLRFPEDIPMLRSVMDTLLRYAAQRALDARVEEAKAVSRELHARLADLSRRVSLSRQSFARAQEHVMRAYGLHAFTRAGGTPASFDRCWQETFDDMLKAVLRGAGSGYRALRPALPARAPVP